MSVFAGGFIAGSGMAQELSEADFLVDLPTVLFESNANNRIRLLDDDGALQVQTLPYILASGDVEPEEILGRGSATWGNGRSRA